MSERRGDGSIPPIGERALREGERRQPIRWPASRDVGRHGDMTAPEDGHIRVLLDSDNDVIVEIWEARRELRTAASASIEFCTPGAGGGMSPRTRIALIELMSAIEEDNREAPSKAYRQG